MCIRGTGGEARGGALQGTTAVLKKKSAWSSEKPVHHVEKANKERPPKKEV